MPWRCSRRSPRTRTRAVPGGDAPRSRALFPSPTASSASRTACHRRRGAPRGRDRAGARASRATVGKAEIPKANSSLNVLIVAAVVALGIGCSCRQPSSRCAEANGGAPEACPSRSLGDLAGDRPRRFPPPPGGAVRPGAGPHLRGAGCRQRSGQGRRPAGQAGRQPAGYGCAPRAPRWRHAEREAATTRPWPRVPRRTAERRRTMWPSPARARQARRDLDRAQKNQRSGGAGDVNKARDGVKQASNHFGGTRVPRCARRRPTLPRRPGSRPGSLPRRRAFPGRGRARAHAHSRAVRPATCCLQCAHRRDFRALAREPWSSAISPR